MKKAFFRFYEELNDFLPVAKYKQWFDYSFEGNPSIKDAIEAIGVPHVEIDLILVNGHSVSFDYHLQEADRVSVYPVFEKMDISEISKLRRKPLRSSKFILDVHLGKLAGYLRMLGFDSLYRNDYKDEDIIHIAVNEQRIILTRDIGILKYNIVDHGYWIRSQNPQDQLQEVINYFNLQSTIEPFKRCINCNGIIRRVSKHKIKAYLKPKTERWYQEFYQCESCKKIYWKGSHYKKIKKFVKKLKS